MQVGVCLTTVMTLLLLSLVKSKLTGHVCFSLFPRTVERCCIDSYAKGDACTNCPLGFHGYNCSEVCPLGYYGLRCLSICNCSNTEICNSSYGCIDVREQRPACQEENCDIEKQQKRVRHEKDETFLEGSNSGKTNTTYQPGEGSQSNSRNFNVYLLAFLGSTTFLFCLVGSAVHLRLRYDSKRTAKTQIPTNRSSWKTHYVHCTEYEYQAGRLEKDLSSGGRSQPSAGVVREYNGEEEHVELGAYDDIRISRMLPGCSVENFTPGHEYSSGNSIDRNTLRRSSRHLLFCQ